MSGGMAQSRMSESKLTLPRTGGRHGEFDAPHADAHQGAKLQQPEADRAAGGLGELCARQPDAYITTADPRDPALLQDIWLRRKAIELHNCPRISVQSVSPDSGTSRSRTLRPDMSLFHGLSAFPITPADEQGLVDTGALTTLLQRLVVAEVDSIGLLGSTGTYPYLTRSQRRRAVEAAVECSGGRVPIIVGIGALRTSDAQDLARDAQAAGADGLLLAPVSYAPLTDEEVFQHFVSVAAATDLSLCIYNNPNTTHFAFSDELIARLSAVPRIVAVKNPAPSPADAVAKVDALRRKLPTDFAVGYSVDWHAAAAVLAGGVAWYSVVGGLLPGPSLALLRAAQARDAIEVRRIDATLQPLWDLFKEFSSLRVVYAAANLLGLTDAQPPKPILPLGAAQRERIKLVLAQLNV
jgi:4-hydroxy-tetrahydrodipicolinate synthase